MKVIPNSLGTTLTVHTANLIGFRSTQVLRRVFPERSNQGRRVGDSLPQRLRKGKEQGGRARGESGLHRNSTSAHWLPWGGTHTLDQTSLSLWPSVQKHGGNELCTDGKCWTSEQKHKTPPFELFLWVFWSLRGRYNKDGVRLPKKSSLFCFPSQVCWLCKQSAKCGS